MVKVLKTQDAGYIRTQRAIEESVSLSRHHIVYSTRVTDPSAGTQQKVTRLNERLHTLVEIPTASTSAAAADNNDEDGDDWDLDMMDDDVPSSAPIRSHVIFTDNLHKGAFLPEFARPSASH